MKDFWIYITIIFILLNFKKSSSFLPLSLKELLCQGLNPPFLHIWGGSALAFL